MRIVMAIARRRISGDGETRSRQGCQGCRWISNAAWDVDTIARSRFTGVSAGVVQVFGLDLALLCLLTYAVFSIGSYVSPARRALQQVHFWTRRRTGKARKGRHGGGKWAGLRSSQRDMHGQPRRH